MNRQRRLQREAREFVSHLVRRGDEARESGEIGEDYEALLDLWHERESLRVSKYGQHGGRPNDEYCGPCNAVLQSGERKGKMCNKNGTYWYAVREYQVYQFWMCKAHNKILTRNGEINVTDGSRDNDPDYLVFDPDKAKEVL
jgi:hypothetical protein